MRSERFGEMSNSEDTIDSVRTTNDDENSSGSRLRLDLRLRSHAEYLNSNLELIESKHREAGIRLANWIATNHRSGKPVDIIVVCTGNSRRSILGSSMGNLAAAFVNMPNVRFHSGGTAPTSFDRRTVNALRKIGFCILEADDRLSNGMPDSSNPIYRVAWGKGLEMLEFSKRFDDPANPGNGFAALMVCNEADESCPVVSGAELRLSIPFQDPKAFDDRPFEDQGYAERRDEIGRFMMFAMLETRKLLACADAKNLSE